MIQADGKYTTESVRKLTPEELITEARKYLITSDYVGRVSKAALLEAIIQAWNDQATM